MLELTDRLSCMFNAIQMMIDKHKYNLCPLYASKYNDSYEPHDWSKRTFPMDPEQKIKEMFKLHMPLASIEKAKWFKKHVDNLEPILMGCLFVGSDELVIYIRKLFVDIDYCQIMQKCRRSKVNYPQFDEALNICIPAYPCVIGDLLDRIHIAWCERRLNFLRKEFLDYAPLYVAFSLNDDYIDVLRDYICDFVKRDLVIQLKNLMGVNMTSADTTARQVFIEYNIKLFLHHFSVYHGIKSSDGKPVSPHIIKKALSFVSQCRHNSNEIKTLLTQFDDPLQNT